MARVSKGFAAPLPPAASASVAGVPPAVAPRAEKTPEQIEEICAPRHDLKVYFTLDELAGKNILPVIQERICVALDALPCRNVREMKQIVALQEKIAKLSKGGKRHGRAVEDQAGS